MKRQHITDWYAEVKLMSMVRFTLQPSAPRGQNSCYPLRRFQSCDDENKTIAIVLLKKTTQVARLLNS
jgi:hypothetical protein